MPGDAPREGISRLSPFLIRRLNNPTDSRSLERRAFFRSPFERPIVRFIIRKSLKRFLTSVNHFKYDGAASYPYFGPRAF